MNANGRESKKHPTFEVPRTAGRIGIGYLTAGYDPALRPSGRGKPRPYGKIPQAAGRGWSGGMTIMEHRR